MIINTIVNIRHNDNASNINNVNVDINSGNYNGVNGIMVQIIKKHEI